MFVGRSLIVSDLFMSGDCIIWLQQIKPSRLLCQASVVAFVTLVVAKGCRTLLKQTFKVTWFAPDCGSTGLYRCSMCRKTVQATTLACWHGGRSLMRKSSNEVMCLMRKSRNEVMSTFGGGLAIRCRL